MIESNNSYTYPILGVRVSCGYFRQIFAKAGRAAFCGDKCAAAEAEDRLQPLAGFQRTFGVRGPAADGKRH